MLKADAGDTVKVNYLGRLTDGTVFDSSEGKPPLHFIIGRQEVIEGFDQAVVGMVDGEKKTVTVPFSQAYGPHHVKLVEEVDRKLLPADLELTVGGQLEVTREDGEIMHFFINALTDTTVTLDANHPLAGKDLVFDIEMLEIQKPAKRP
jgi:peptidylprolyl isomerase